MAENENKLSDEQLQERWKTDEGQAFRAEIIRQLQAEETYHIVNWENLKVVVNGEKKLWRDFPGVIEVKIQSEEEDISSIIEGYDDPFAVKNARWGDLRFIVLSDVEIQEAFLSFANLQKASLYWAKLQNAELNLAKLQNTELGFADLQNAELHWANLQNASLYAANLQNTKLNNANLQNADLNYATFRLKSFRWRVGIWQLLEKWGKDISRFRPTLLAGADLSGIKLGSSPTMRRKLLDEVYLEDFAKNHSFFYPLWLWTSNCGRSPVLVGGWALLIGVIFGAIFAYYPYIGPDWACLKDLLVIDKPMFVFRGDDWWRPYYHSFTTLTTLGWGSAEPNSTTGFWWHTFENIGSYVMLGYLVAVTGDLLTRRSA